MPKNVDIVFLFPPENGNFLFDDFENHLGIGYIQAMLKKRGHSSKQFVSTGTLTLTQFKERIMALKPKVVGFSCYETNYYLCRLLSFHLKKAMPDCWIFFGGPVASLYDRFILEENPWVDVCVRFWGELSTTEAIEKIKESPHQKDVDLGKINGISFRKNNHVQQNSPRTFSIPPGFSHENSLDVFPSPILEGFAENPFQFVTSRGCPGNCSYCCFRLMGEKTIHYHSVERVVQELKSLLGENGGTKAEKGKKYLFLNDDCFTANRKRTEALCRRLISEGLEKKFVFGVDTRADMVDSELLSLMKKAGINNINFGLESGAPKILRLMKKALPPYDPNYQAEERFLEKTRVAVKAAKELGMKTSVSIILGMPGETLKEGKKTLDLVKELDVERYYRNHLVATPFTELFEKRKALGLKIGRQKDPRRFCIYPVTYGYDLDRLKALPNEDELLNRNKKLDGVFKALAPTAFGAGETKEFTSFVYLSPKTPVKKQVKDWIEENCFINSDIIYSNQKQMGQLCQWPYPASPRFHSVDEDKFKRFIEYKKPFSRFNPKKEYNRVTLFSIDKKEDLKSYLGLCKRLAYKQRLLKAFKKDVALAHLLPRPFTKKRAALIDGCKFCAEPCPLPKLPKAFIDGDQIKGCYGSAPLGQTNQSRQGLVTRIKEKIRAETERRGCASCPVEKTCSKCPYPHPLTAEEYCQIQRGLPEAGLTTEAIKQVVRG